MGISLDDFESTPGDVIVPYHCGSIRACGLESDQISYLNCFYFSWLLYLVLFIFNLTLIVTGFFLFM